MIRPVTCICMLLAGASGLYLYQSKHRAQLLDREIVRTIRATAQTRERIMRLREEWALLNEPDRLAELSQQHLALRTLSPTQYVPVAELASRLPVQAAPAAPVSKPSAEKAIQQLPKRHALGNSDAAILNQGNAAYRCRGSGRCESHDPHVRHHSMHLRKVVYV